MKRNVFGAAIVAGGLALFTGVAGFAVDYSTEAAAKTAVSTCAGDAVKALTVPNSLTGEAKDEANALKAETIAAIGEVVAEANSKIHEAVAENTDEDGAKDAAAITAELTAIVNWACNTAIPNLTAHFNAAIAELVAESTNVEEPEANTPDVDKPEKAETAERD